MNSGFDWLPVTRLAPVTGYSQGGDCPARCGPADSDRLLSLGDALRQSLQRGGHPRFDCLNALHTALVCDTSPAIYALQPDAHAIPDDFHRFGWLTPAQAHRLHTEEVTAAVARVQADRADSGITADEISFRDFRALVCDPGKPALVRRLAVILNGAKGGGAPDPLGLFRKLDETALYELWDECRHTSRPPFTWADFDGRSDRSADELLNDADSVDLTFLDCVAIKLTDADRLLGHLLPAPASEQVMPAAPQPQPVQSQQEGNHRQSLAQQYGLQPIKSSGDLWQPEMQIALAVAFEELTTTRNHPAGEAWEIVSPLCGGVSRPAMRKHRHKGVELKNERNRLLKSA